MRVHKARVCWCGCAVYYAYCARNGMHHKKLASDWSKVDCSLCLRKRPKKSPR